MLAVIFVASLLPPDNLPSGGNDKLQHFFSYSLLTWVFVLVFHPNSNKRRFILIIQLIAFGGMIELLQGLTSYRSAEWLDLLANCMGILFAVLLTPLKSHDLLVYMDKKIAIFIDQ